ncbi:hypothetical protein MLD38_021359 [Melastoma candidum]|uniref:Uncharacterized protein n=1 Tax=Melastoma candidum TaxID=119954 RepID=A0ACB9QG43_9MYRT|nr:hypothetical protein MLD38_021359 [Melastoma candidum]
MNESRSTKARSKQSKGGKCQRVLRDVRSFHDLASFYRRFIRGFSSIVSPLAKCLKGDKFEWSSAAQASFQRLKECLSEALVLALPDFAKMFEVE